MKKEIISITGLLGSGKSSTADLIAKTLGFSRFSSGDFFRKIGINLGISVNEVNKRAEADPAIDKMTDDEVRKVGQMEKVVIDSRMAFHFIPESFKVYLYLPPEIAKERILKNLEENKLRRASEDTADASEVYKKIIERSASEKKRYMEMYGVDITDKSNFDLVIDTSKNNIDQVAEAIVSGYKKWIADQDGK